MDELFTSEFPDACNQAEADLKCAIFSAKCAESKLLAKFYKCRIKQLGASVEKISRLKEKENSLASKILIIRRLANDAARQLMVLQKESGGSSG